MLRSLPGAKPKTNQVTVATGTSAVLLAAATTEPFKRAAASGVLIKALTTNTAAIYLGDSGVTVATGYELMPGEGISVPLDDLSKMFGITTGTQKICYMYLGGT